MILIYFTGFLLVAAIFFIGQYLYQRQEYPYETTKQLIKNHILTQMNLIEVLLFSVGSWFTIIMLIVLSIDKFFKT